MSNMTLEDLDKITFLSEEEFEAFRDRIAEDDWLWSTAEEGRPLSYPCVAVVQPVIYNNDAGTAKLEAIFVYPSDFEPQ